MEKLTIEYLAPYLPYGLKVAKKLDWHTENWNNPEILIMTQITDCENDWFYIGARKPENWISHISSEERQFKPILRPLSDLTQDIVGFHIDTEMVKKEYSESPNAYQYLEYDIVLILLKNHFDVFGLIEKGLAIDINTLTKEAGEGRVMEEYKNRRLKLMSRINQNAVEYFFRNQGTGKPTLRHIINETTEKTFCGFNHEIAQSVFEDDNSRGIVYGFEEYHPDTCLKCMKAYELLTTTKQNNR